ncbi:TolC family protein [Halomonas denitrificans]|uniref:TolC family protein n=1 Tax=Halomonas TaxID=2745 RepID=UPI001C966EBD|nr:MULTISPECIES: TolC family protein [Halomonas]MBY5931010.1 TolC family protein [Halomonas sp. DP8Y7-3]MCA0973327.1 TolC family protein [Halomonas denitrificans]
MVRAPFPGLLAGVLLLTLAGCSMIDEPTSYPDKTNALIAQVPDWSAAVGGSDVGSLNDLIASDALDQLVEKALQANPGLQQTLLTLRIRQTQLRQTGADRLPEVEAGFSASDSEDSASTYSGSVTVSWEADLWQKIADRTAAADQDVAQQAALYQAARDTLAADVMTSWLALIAQRHAITIQQQRLSTLESNESLILERYRSGLGNLEDLDSARSSTASARASLVEYQESLAQQQRALQTLLGEIPDSGEAVADDYPAVLTPLAELPSQSLRRRPDLIAAYHAVQAADYRTHAAYKDLLPSISLQAAIEDVADSPSQALLTDPVWSLLGQLTAPLFQGGELRAAADEAELETAQAYQAYRETLLEAVGEVEDALGLERSLALQQQHIANALDRQQSTLAQYQSSYRSGLVDILDLLSVQQQTYDLEAQLDDLNYQRLANRIDLGLALGLGVNP